MYCTYLTVYHGNKLPPFYIGSSKPNRIKKGYHGSVSSTKYGKIWESEIQQNPHLFKTYIITKHSSDTEAKQKELHFHRKLNVVKSSMYINMSEARVNGFFGRDVSGSNNPLYGKTGKENPRYGTKHSIETRLKMSITNSHPMSDSQKRKLSIANTGKKLSAESIIKAKETIRKKKEAGIYYTQIIKICPYCRFSGRGSAMKRYHFDMCHSKKDSSDVLFCTDLSIPFQCG